MKWNISYSPQKRDTTSTQIRNYSLLATPRREKRIQIRNYSEDFLQADVQLTSSFDLGQTSHKVIYGFAGDITKSNYDGDNITTNLNTGVTTVTPRQGFNFPKVDTIRADFYVQDEIKLLDERLTLTLACVWRPIPSIRPRMMAMFRLMGLSRKRWMKPV
ncbi:hypothetical protein DEA98_19455 [Brucella pseudogrignonensis]|nr:hypothetical protein [Brucella pseudogrignonensis]